MHMHERVEVPQQERVDVSEQDGGGQGQGTTVFSDWRVTANACDTSYELYLFILFFIVTMWRLRARTRVRLVKST